MLAVHVWEFISVEGSKRGRGQGGRAEGRKEESGEGRKEVK